MGVDELAVMVNLSRKVRIVLIRRLEDDLSWIEKTVLARDTCRTYLGTIDQVVPGKVYFAKRTLANEFPYGVIPDVFEFSGRKLPAAQLIECRTCEAATLTPAVQNKSSQAVGRMQVSAGSFPGRCGG